MFKKKSVAFETYPKSNNTTLGKTASSLGFERACVWVSFFRHK